MRFGIKDLFWLSLVVAAYLRSSYDTRLLLEWYAAETREAYRARDLACTDRDFFRAFHTWLHESHCSHCEECRRGVGTKK